ncbi:MAG: S-methyl-5-thioribose-1-phosphate isomerase [Gemmatimonadaceae bacterium]
MAVIESVRWSPGGAGVRIIDQTQLPDRLVERDIRTLTEVCEAIEQLCVRGAPAIGVAGAMGLVVSLVPFTNEPRSSLLRRVREHADRIRATRPTAVNLPRAIDRMSARAHEIDGSAVDVLEALRSEATALLEEDRAMCLRIGDHALPLVADRACILTHCNAGALATTGIGTALAPIYLAHAMGRRVEVIVDETRPLLQGSRLTAWELSRAGIPVTVIADGAAASLMRSGAISLCIVGADRIAANGDVANKIGTYGLALAAQHHGVPFYVAAPSSTLDRSLPNGDVIPIERRAPDEIARLRDTRLVPEAARVDNPAFDVTPWEMITAIVTDEGVFRRPFDFAQGAQGARVGEARSRAATTP